MLARGNVGWQDQLLSIMMGTPGGGNADEMVFLGFFEQEEALDHVGRNYARIGTTFKGLQVSKTLFYKNNYFHFRDKILYWWQYRTTSSHMVQHLCSFQIWRPRRIVQVGYSLLWIHQTYNMLDFIVWTNGKRVLHYHVILQLCRQIYHNGEFNFEEGGNGHIDTNWLPGKNLSIGIRLALKFFLFTSHKSQKYLTQLSNCLDLLVCQSTFFIGQNGHVGTYHLPSHCPHLFLHVTESHFHDH